MYLYSETLPNATIASHIDMKLICQTINLFRGHPTVAEHTNLFAKIRKIFNITLRGREREKKNTRGRR